MLLKDFIRFIVFMCINLLIPKRPIRPKTLAIVKLDVIGDYILFRNFIQEIKESERYKDFQITLIGNSVYKDLAIGLDQQFVSDFIFLNFKAMTRNVFYRIRTLKEICSEGYEVVLNPTFSREFNVTDCLVHALSANEKVASFGTLGNIPAWQKKISDHFYTKLIPVKDGIEFEFIRNKELVEHFLGETVKSKKPTCDIQENFKLNVAKFVVLFPGASTSVRRWPVRNFAEIAKHCITEYDLDVVILGSKEDCDLAKEIQRETGSTRVHDLTGKTNLTETLQVIKKAKLMLSNETSGPHLAVMVDVPVIVIYNGNNFKRFIPYPKEMGAKHFPVFHPYIEKDFAEYEKISNMPGYLSRLDMNEIDCEKVLKIISSKKELLA